MYPPNFFKKYCSHFQKPNNDNISAKVLGLLKNGFFFFFQVLISKAKAFIGNLVKYWGVVVCGLGKKRHK